MSENRIKWIKKRYRYSADNVKIILSAIIAGRNVNAVSKKVYNISCSTVIIYSFFFREREDLIGAC